MAANPIDVFLNKTLVSWLKSCLPRPENLTGYGSLLDGSIIHSVWLQIDPESRNHPAELNGQSGKPLRNARARNFGCIVRNLITHFEEKLSRRIFILPDFYSIGFNPETLHAVEQMNLLLLLLLGAAVQCPDKEFFIGRITELDVDTQHAIEKLIKQVTDNYTLLLSDGPIHLLTPVEMYTRMLRLAEDPDSMYIRRITPEIYQNLPLSPNGMRPHGC